MAFRGVAGHHTAQTPPTNYQSSIPDHALVWSALVCTHSRPQKPCPHNAANASLSSLSARRPCTRHMQLIFLGSGISTPPLHPATPWTVQAAHPQNSRFRAVLQPQDRDHPRQARPAAGSCQPLHWIMRIPRDGGPSRQQLLEQHAGVGARCRVLASAAQLLLALLVLGLGGLHPLDDLPLDGLVLRALLQPQRLPGDRADAAAVAQPVLQGLSLEQVAVGRSDCLSQQLAVDGAAELRRCGRRVDAPDLGDVRASQPLDLALGRARTRGHLCLRAPARQGRQVQGPKTGTAGACSSSNDGGCDVRRCGGSCCRSLVLQQTLRKVGQALADQPVHVRVALLYRAAPTGARRF
mmetsp:Transcript_82207/g.232792  ORF Transcript_82207/g.232792 Transcript_82207/m.232792 type:complete len:352 (+) Transcript_82207:223-1278(+)